MERTRIAKVDDVKLIRRGEQVDGTLHLTPHHLIFCHTPAATSDNPTPKQRELWITYPIIHTCTLRPNPPASRLLSSIRLRCRDFTFACFCFLDEKKARDVYDSIKAWTCKLGKIEKLYAFSYAPQKPEKDINGWTIYNARQEWNRLRVGEKGTDKGWRISCLNTDYSFSPTYPALLVVPSAISDNTLNYAGKYRSRIRLPVLTYLHPVNNCSITRCAQPLVGVRQNRSIQDEKLLLAIFSTSHSNASSISETPSRPRSPQSMRSSEGDISVGSDPPLGDAEALEDEMISKAGSDAKSDEPKIYGAQQHNLIVDARPTVNALAMQAVGLGSENMDNYKFATKIYLGIDNIHVMRDSLQKVIETLKDSDLTPYAPNREALASSKWLKHIAGLLDGAGIIARQVGLQHSHVMIHCSDGWDRTSQLSALSQLCLDPYYRTVEGFIILVEKDWLSFGHQFRHRSGPLSSDKWFNIENERLGGESEGKPSLVGQNSGAGQALENALLSAKGFFNKDNKSRDSMVDSDGELQPYDMGSPNSKKTPIKAAKDDKSSTKVKETSPVFHQFLDATYQLLHQHPTRFEFNERFLRRLLYHLYSCQYGTFLFDNERERVEARAAERTRSVWDYFLSRKEQFTNEKYNGVIDDNIRGQERLLLPMSAGHVGLRWWHEVFGRTDAEMNGPPPPITMTTTSKVPAPRTDENGFEPSTVLTGVGNGFDKPVSSNRQQNASSTPEPSILTGVETFSNSIGAGAAKPGTVNTNPHLAPVSPAPAKSTSLAKADPTAISVLAAGLDGLGVQNGKVDGGVAATDTADVSSEPQEQAKEERGDDWDPLGVKRQMELEMQ